MSSLLMVTEGGKALGLGHIRRCLSLAGALRDAGVTVAFRVAGDEGARAFVRQAGFRLDEHETDGVLFDSYSLTERDVRAFEDRKKIAIDDLQRSLPVDLVIDPAPGQASHEPRAQWSSSSRSLLGPRYALLRPEFRDLPERRTRPAIERVLITLGGGDTGALLGRVAQSCTAAFPGAAIDAVAGPFAGGSGTLEGVTILKEPDMREIMMRADIAVSAAGQTLFELAATGTPAIAVVTADNQRRNIAGFVTAGTVLDGTGFGEACERIRSVELRQQMSVRGRQLVDGRGAERVAAAVVELLESK